MSLKRFSLRTIAPKLIARSFLTGMLLCLAPHYVRSRKSKPASTPSSASSPPTESRRDLAQAIWSRTFLDVKLVSIDYDNARATFPAVMTWRHSCPTTTPKKPPTPAEIEQRLSRLLTEASSGTFSLKLTPTVPKRQAGQNRG